MTALQFHIQPSREAPGDLRVVVFDNSGGTIGRAATNTLVLDDPERTVSRVHAQVLYRDGRFFVIDRGSNPLLVNGRALGTGNETVLAADDRLVIGGFELKVELQATSIAVPAAINARPASAMSSDDPFADLLAGLAPPPAPAAAGARTPAAAATCDDLLFPDPLAMSPPARGAAAADPFANLLGPVSSSAPAAGLGSLDDFSDLGVAKGGGRSKGIDDLFGDLGGLGAGSDPLALSPLADPLLQPNTASSADPLAALQRAAPGILAPRSDHLSIDQFGFAPPQATTSPSPAPAMLPSNPAATATAVKSFAFDDTTGLPVLIICPPVVKNAVDSPAALAQPIHPPASAAPAVLAPLPAPSAPPVVALQVPAAVAGPPVSASSATDDELLAAFVSGLATSSSSGPAPISSLTPALMERVGCILRVAIEGTLQLLLTRQEFKREVRAEVTMIASQANNPLKFSPTVDVALAHLLGPQVRGFMPPEAAMRDAFNDLRAHQFGVMVGMRAALAHVIARFEPAELEKKIAAKTALDAIFSSNRKARLWDQFMALYAGIATEAEDDFHSLFGKAFLQAYEEQMARLKDAENR